MLKINNTLSDAQKDTSWVVEGVIFSMALCVWMTLSHPSSAEGMLENKIHIPDLTREEVVVWAWLLALWTAANTQWWWMNIHIPMQDIEDAVIAYCTSTSSNLLACLDMYMKK